MPLTRALVVLALVISGWGLKGVVPYLDPTEVGPQAGPTVVSAPRVAEGDLGWIPALDGNGLGRTRWELPLIPA